MKDRGALKTMCREFAALAGSGIAQTAVAAEACGPVEVCGDADLCTHFAALFVIAAARF